MQYSAVTISLDQQPIKELRNRSNQELVSYVLERFHQVHRLQLEELLLLAAKVEQAHGDHEACPSGLFLLLERIQRELEQHMLKEEQILFPMLLNGQYPRGPIAVMESEHEEHEAAIAELLAVTHNLTLPAGACGTWQALYGKLNEFIQDIRSHIEIENNVLFVSEHARSGQCCGGCQ
ncbi:hemerythrin domain-containing protein [Aliidiomarina indica]|uniref:hemerythrin domain-containing protein n=1 Tax=Aliidiomarina indica TaxID=2749147 RepID=UPI001890740F|nr:hemerythrin domain-containing protein [Aliidiomarina indica]